MDSRYELIRMDPDKHLLIVRDIFEKHFGFQQNLDYARNALNRDYAMCYMVWDQRVCLFIGHVMASLRKCRRPGIHVAWINELIVLPQYEKRDIEMRLLKKIIEDVNVAVEKGYNVWEIVSYVPMFYTSVLNTFEQLDFWRHSSTYHERFKQYAELMVLNVQSVQDRLKAQDKENETKAKKEKQKIHFKLEPNEVDI